MTPIATLLDLIEQLPPEERQHVDEYIHFLYKETHTSTPSDEVFDPRYTEYIKAGIAEGEEGFKKGDVLSVEEGKDYLEKLLNK